MIGGWLWWQVFLVRYIFIRPVEFFIGSMVPIPLVQVVWDGVIGFTGCCNGFSVQQMVVTRLRLFIRWIVLKNGMAFVFRLFRS